MSRTLPIHGSAYRTWRRKCLRKSRGADGDTVWLLLQRHRRYGSRSRFLAGKASEGGRYNPPVVMYRGRRYPGWNKRVGTLRPLLRFQWND